MPLTLFRIRVASGLDTDRVYAPRLVSYAIRVPSLETVSTDIADAVSRTSSGSVMANRTTVCGSGNGLENHQTALVSAATASDRS